MVEHVVEDYSQEHSPDETPALWNPSASACWALLFFPIAPYLHGRNWRALGESDRAQASAWWIAAAFILHPALLALILFHPNLFPPFWFWPASVNGNSNLGKVLFLEWPAWLLALAWYWTQGREQIAYVGTWAVGYRKKGWLGVTLLTVPAMLVWAATTAAVLLLLYILLMILGASALLGFFALHGGH